MSEVAATKAESKSFARDLVALTKPRIISLLLVTTIAPMYVAGDPSWQLVLAVFVGGYLMAGGANAVNMYMDRDIDDRMSRTRLRPIPSGRMRAEAVLAFGVLCATTATFLFAHVANVLTAALALGRILHLRVRLHAVAQAQLPTEHRDRRCGGRLPAARRLGGRHRAHRSAGRLSVPHHLLLDAAALLGARAR